MDKGKLYFSCGISRSGKSTYANNTWLKEPNSIRPRVVLSGDSFRTAIHAGEYCVESEGLVFATLDVCARALLNDGYDVFIDETCTTEATLLRYLKLDLNATRVLFETPLEECIARALYINKPYLIGPMKRMKKQLDHLLENWDEIYTRLKVYLEERKKCDIKC